MHVYYAVVKAGYLQYQSRIIEINGSSKGSTREGLTYNDAVCGGQEESRACVESGHVVGWQQEVQV